MADIIKGIAPQKDTYANWVTANPTLGKDSGGNSYGQIIIVTGSPVGDLILWGNNQTFAVAYAAGQYTISNPDTSIPIVHNISAANQTVTLPAITGLKQRFEWFWTGGTGSFVATPTVTDGATINGIAAALWLGEGTGHAVIVSDGTNWQVEVYEDSGSDWNKYSNGILENRETITLSYLATTVLETDWTYPHAYVTGTKPSILFTAYRASPPTTIPGYTELNPPLLHDTSIDHLTARVLMSIDVQAVSNFGVSDTSKVEAFATGRWRT